MGLPRRTCLCNPLDAGPSRRNFLDRRAWNRDRLRPMVHPALTLQRSLSNRVHFSSRRGCSRRLILHSFFILGQTIDEMQLVGVLALIVSIYLTSSVEKHSTRLCARES